MFGVRLWGLPAWIVWAFVHLMYLVQFESRVLVFIKWAVQDLTFNRGSRLITGAPATDFCFREARPSPSAQPKAVRPELVARS